MCVRDCPKELRFPLSGFHVFFSPNKRLSSHSILNGCILSGGGGSVCSGQGSGGNADGLDVLNSPEDVNMSEALPWPYASGDASSITESVVPFRGAKRQLLLYLVNPH